MPAHHPSETVLTELASGAIGQSSAVVVASHLALCAHCRERLGELEWVGGELLAGAPPAPIGTSLLSAVMERLDEPFEPEPPPVCIPDAIIPAPLMEYLRVPFDDVSWRRVSAGLSVHDVVAAQGGPAVKLMRIAAGQAMPSHTHAGRELTLVLAGRFADDTGHFVRGDLAEVEPAVEHRPIADDDGDCICVAVNEGPVRLTGLVGRLLNPLLKF